MTVPNSVPLHRIVRTLGTTLCLYAITTLSPSVALADSADNDPSEDLSGTIECDTDTAPCDGWSVAIANMPFGSHWYPENLAPDPTAGNNFNIIAGADNTILDGTQYDFRAQEPLIRRLLKIRELRLLTLWENEGTRLFLGVGRDGLAGLNISTTRQRKKSAGKPRRNSRPIIFDPYRDSGASSP